MVTIDEVLNLGEQWWDNLVKKENTPSNPDM